jgi:hypothetical protein
MRMRPMRYMRMRTTIESLSQIEKNSPTLTRDLSRRSSGTRSSPAGCAETSFPQSLLTGPRMRRSGDVQQFNAMFNPACKKFRSRGIRTNHSLIFGIILTQRRYVTYSEKTHIYAKTHQPDFGFPMSRMFMRSFIDNLLLVEGGKLPKETLYCIAETGTRFIMRWTCIYVYMRCMTRKPQPCAVL